ncbi:MAG: oxalate:formate antiporter, partial [Candidatus Electrothrix sp. AUS1_2]|nr:oxalate:formate antiporter [Candidatus Electrothrix sp. AUS1_2]
GLVFTSWGLGGFTLSLLAGQVYDRTQTFTFAYYCSAALLIAAALMALCLKPVEQKLS